MAPKRRETNPMLNFLEYLEEDSVLDVAGGERLVRQRMPDLPRHAVAARSGSQVPAHHQLRVAPAERG